MYSGKSLLFSGHLRDVVSCMLEVETETFIFLEAVHHA